MGCICISWYGAHGVRMREKEQLSDSPKSGDDFHNVETLLSGCLAGATVVKWCLQWSEVQTT